MYISLARCGWLAPVTTFRGCTSTRCPAPSGRHLQSRPPPPKRAASICVASVLCNAGPSNVLATDPKRLPGPATVVWTALRRRPGHPSSRLIALSNASMVITTTRHDMVERANGVISDALCSFDAGW